MKTLIKLLTVGALTAMVSCGGDDDPLALAWEKFQYKDYAGAHAEFYAHREMPEAIAGLAWTTMRMDSITESAAYFASVAEGADVLAGWAIVSWRLGDYAASIIHANDLEALDPTYAFEFDNDVNIFDVRLHKAYSQFYLQNYTACNATIKQIQSTWVETNDVNGLLAKLQSLYQDLK